MTDIKELTEGKDHFSGKIMAFTILGPTDDFADSGLYHLRLSIDTKQYVYLKANKKYIDLLAERKDSTATFIGEYLEGGTVHLGCDAVVFWRDELTQAQ